MGADKKVLFILTSHSQLGDSGKLTGWWLTEFAHPYKVIAPHAEVVVASPAGGSAPIDAASLDAAKDDVYAQSFLSEQESLYKNTVKISSLHGKASEFDAVLVVGGHGPMFDLATDKDSITLLEEFAAAGKVVSAVCHGPASLIGVNYNGEPILKGQPVTGLSNDEEEIVGAVQYLPFKLEDSLIAKGGQYEKADKVFGPHVVVARDGKLITGQNPASATPIGEAVLKAIGV